MSSNPLLVQPPLNAAVSQNGGLPPFSSIEVEHIEPAIRELVERNEREIEQLLSSQTTFSWASLLQPIEDMEDELSKAWSPISHLNSVRNSDAWREAYNNCLPLLSEHGTWLGQNQALFEAYRQIGANADAEQLSRAQRKALEHSLRDFHLAGVTLPDKQKLRYGQLQKRLSELGSKFSENVLDATSAWSRNCTEEELQGLPESALASARQTALQADQSGYLINLEFPSYYPVLTYCDTENLRREVYEASVTRASDLGPHAGQWDNAEIITETLNLRRELSQLLGFANYAELSLATKMADTPEQVTSFMEELVEKSREQALLEWRELQSFAQEEYAVDKLNAWDVSYYSEKLRQQRYQISQEDIRPYLPANRALQGLFEVVHRLYGIRVEEILEFDSYHSDVQLYNVLQDNEVIARFYLDLYARPDKRGGAWMDVCRSRRLDGAALELPVAYLTCNFTAPIGDEPALLTHNELTTLFHEFGHGLHHMLTLQTVAAVSGISGVAWDAVELPSQFLENWCWEPEALAFISGHYETGEPLPAELLEKMLAARNFQSAMMLARQLEFSLFDFTLHRNWDGGDSTLVQAQLNEVRELVSVVPTATFNRFQNGFSHIFAGGYAAGYYSYKWAEVLSADAYSRFEEEGIFSTQAGTDFRQHVLAVGGSVEPMDAFVKFRGREPDIGPLLRHSGISV